MVPLVKQIIERKCTKTDNSQSTPASWISKETSHLIKKLDTMQRKSRKNNNQTTLSKIIQLNDEISKRTEEDQLNYETEVLSSKRFSKIQGFQRSVKKAKSLTVKTEQQSNELNKAELFNQFFHNVFNSKTKNTNQQFPKIIHNLMPYTRDQISFILKKLDFSKSKGLDGIANLILKQLSTSLSVSLHSIWKTCLNKGKFTFERKESVIRPIYSDGIKTALHNYRPINCLSCPSKFFEKVIFDGLFNCINDQIHDSQYGFRPKRSATVQLLCFLHKIYTFNDQKSTEELAVFYLDFRKR